MVRRVYIATTTCLPSAPPPAVGRDGRLQGARPSLVGGRFGIVSHSPSHPHPQGRPGHSCIGHVTTPRDDGDAPPAGAQSEPPWRQTASSARQNIVSALGAVSGDAPCHVAPLALTGASLSGAQGGSFFCYPPTRPCRWGLAWKAGLSLALLWLLWASASRRLISRPVSAWRGLSRRFFDASKASHLLPSLLR